MQKGINTYYPGTKLGFTEYGYGGENHISGGIAAADMLGICGRFGIYWCSIWGAVDQYIGSAYKIYRNYDGKKSTFGDWHVYARPNDDRTASVYAALQSTDTTKMNIIVMNKDYDSTLTATFKITANTTFTKADIYAFVNGDTNIKHIGTIASIAGNKFNYTIPKLSVYHFVLSGAPAGVGEIENSNGITVYPNPSKGVFIITMPNDADKIEVTDVTGKIIEQITVKQGNTEYNLNLGGLANGVYFARIVSSSGTVVKKLVKE